MNWIQKLILKGVNLNDVLPRFSERASGGQMKTPFTTNVFDKYNLAYDALAKKDYIWEYRNWVFACVNARSESIGNIKLRLINQKTGDETFDHPLLDLLNKPNPMETKYDLFFGTQAFKDLDGNSFWYLARNGTNGKGDIQAIFNLKSDKVKLVIGDNPLYVEGYVYTQPDGSRIPFKPEEILHQRMFNPNAAHPFPHRGMGIVQAAAYAIDTDNETRKWNLAFFRNAARPDGVLYNEGEGTMRSEEFKRIEAEWEERHTGAEKNGKTAVLSGGMKYERVTLSQTEMDFSKQREFGRDEILSMFKVPKTVIGIADDVNRANADAAIYVYNLLTIKPLMQRVVDYINMFLMPLIDETGTYLLDFHSPISEDRAQLLDEYEMAVNTWLTVNEIRDREGLAPVEDGDTLYIPTIDQPIDSDETDDETPEPKKSFLKSLGSAVLEKDPKVILREKKWKAFEAKKKKELKPASKKATTKEIVDTYLLKMPTAKRSKSLDKSVKETYISTYKENSLIRTNNVKKSLVKYFNQQQKEVIANLKEEMKGLEPAEYYLKGMSDILFDQSDAVSTGISLMTPFLKDWLKQSGDSAATLAGGTVFDSSTTFITNWVTNRAQFFADSITQTTQDDLSATIQAGIDAGESLTDISTRVADVYDIAKGARTDMIARTEVAAASNFGAIEAYKQVGVTQHEWAVVDPQDDDCLENDGAIVDIGDEFPSGDEEPPVHPNCQCTTLPVFDDSTDEEDTDENQ